MFDLLKKIFVLQFLFIITLTTLTCKKSPVEPNNFERFTLTFEDASCTEAWFNLKLNNLAKPVMVKVYKDNFLYRSFNIHSTNDTVFYIENLLPKKNYEVFVEVQPANDKVYRSNKLRFTTMDTTSHEFTWQVWEFGDIGSSDLYDVAIIDENNIWAVGEIHIADTSINGYTTYNAVHWDGTKWELLRIPYYYNGQNFYSVIRAIYAFNKNDIWFGIASLIRWNGIEYKSIDTSPFFPALINKMWGSSSEDFYIVGNNGNIAHWDGRRWTKIESGTELDIFSIKGFVEKDKQGFEIICVATSTNETKIFKLRDKKVYLVSSKGLPWGIIDIWFKPLRRYFVVGNGIYYKDYSWDKWEMKRYLTNYFSYSIEGNNLNDVFIVGSFGDFLHFNGYDWYRKIFFEVDEFNRVSVKNNTIVLAGYKGKKAVLVLLKRTKK